MLCLNIKPWIQVLGIMLREKWKHLLYLRSMKRIERIAKEGEKYQKLRRYLNDKEIPDFKNQKERSNFFKMANRYRLDGE